LKKKKKKDKKGGGGGGESMPMPGFLTPNMGMRIF